MKILFVYSVDKDDPTNNKYEIVDKHQDTWSVLCDLRTNTAGLVLNLDTGLVIKDVKHDKTGDTMPEPYIDLFREFYMNTIPKRRRERGQEQHHFEEDLFEL